MKDSLQMIKNPLGIFALFVTFVDGIAGLVISVNFSNLKGGAERLPLIWFVIGFPILILITFAILVIRYNEKLYAPKDFDNQEGFLRANGKSIKPNEDPKALGMPERIPLKNNKKSWSMLAYSNTNIHENLFLQIQDSALQRYSKEKDLEIKTEVQVARNLTCDGVAERNGEIYLFEVKANYQSSMSDLVQKSVKRLSKVLNDSDYEDKYIVLILVTKVEMKAENIKALQEKLKCDGCEVIIENYKKDDILKK